MFSEMTLMPLWTFDAATLNQQLTPEFTSDKRIKVAFDTTDIRAFAEDEDAKWKRLDMAVKTGWIRKNEARSEIGYKPDAEMENEPLPSQLNPFANPNAQQQQDGEPARNGTKQGEYMSKVLQSLVDMGVSGLQTDLEQYFSDQQTRVKNALTRNG